MTNSDLFGGLSNLGGILGGIAKSVVPKDTPEGKLFSAQNDLANLQKQESEILLEIGREAYEQDPSAWPQDAKLKLIRQNIETTQGELSKAKQAQEQADAAKTAAEAKSRCPNCSLKNMDGVKFCQECGTPLSAAVPMCCASCGVEMAPGARFCGECGARQD